MRRLLTLMPVIGLLIFGVLLAAYASDGGVDEPWTNDMNQASYWEARFGADCTKFENHGGFIPAQYDAAVIKDGNYVRIYNPAPSPFTALGPVNPANGQHFGAPHSWIMKCTLDQQTTTTTVPASTTTTMAPTTTTTGPPDTTTTSVGPSSTTSQPTPSTTEATTTTMAPPATTTTLPVEPTTTAPTPSTTDPAPDTTAPVETPVTVDECALNADGEATCLPYTGMGDFGLAALAGVALSALGVALVRGVREN